MIAVLARKYKITFLCHASLAVGAGVERFILSIIKHAPQDKFTICVVQTDHLDRRRFGDEYIKKALKGSKVYTIKSFRMLFRRFATNRSPPIYIILQLPMFLFYFVYGLSNRSIITRISDSDIIYLTQNEDVQLLLGLKSRAIILGSTHTTQLKAESGSKRGIMDYLLKLWLTFKFWRIDGFHFHTAKLARQSIIRKKFDFAGLEYGVDTKLFHPRKKPADAMGVRFLFVGRLEKAKGIVTLLEAWSLMKLNNTELHIAGGGSFQEYVESLAGKNRIYYHGVLDDEKLAELYGTSDVLVFPTEADIYPVVVLEALASGLFVICSDVLRGTFDDFEAKGMLKYVPNNAKSISLHMEATTSKIEEIKKKQAQVIEYIRTNMDWSFVSRQLFEKFEGIAAYNQAIHNTVRGNN